VASRMQRALRVEWEEVQGIKGEIHREANEKEQKQRLPPLPRENGKRMSEA